MGSSHSKEDKGVPGVPPREAKRNEIKTEKETVVMVKEETIVIKETVVKEPIVVGETMVIKETTVVTKSRSTNLDHDRGSDVQQPKVGRTQPANKCPRRPVPAACTRGTVDLSAQPLAMVGRCGRYLIYDRRIVTLN